MRAGFAVLLLVTTCAPVALGVDRIAPLDLRDADGDGYPDAAELVTREDRAAFLEWFALIAEGEAFARDPRWDLDQRDCAGLLRFAYRGALEAHDGRWLAHAPFLSGFAPEVARFHYPDVPVLADRLFRLGGGPFRPERLDLDFGSMATAERLVEGSARPLREGEHPARGDVLLFRSPALGVAHTMVYLGSGRVVYDTGESPDAPDRVRLVSLSDLEQHPDPRWRPLASNADFAGYYRWRIVGPGVDP